MPKNDMPPKYLELRYMQKSPGVWVFNAFRFG